MRKGFVRSSRYSPGNMDRDSLEQLFVGRQAAMEDVVGRLVGSIDTANKHYILLVGPRGSGKTHFLTVAMHRILDALDGEAASDRAVLAVLKEEEWGVASYLDFLVRILRALATDAPELAPDVEEVYARFRIGAEESEELAKALLDRHLAGRPLILFCENLADLFEGLGPEGQKRLRAHMQESGQWALLATTPALFSGITSQSEPFYGFFTVRHLEEINFETASDLLVKKAIHAGKADLARFLATSVGRARTRAVHHLAGGNHRAYVVLFDFLDRESLDDLVPPFMHMVDDLTPYYQDRMRQLAPAQRKIVEFLAQASGAVQVKDVAAGCLMSQQTAAKQIGELASSGFVRRERQGRSTFCELAEPLMRICFEVKDNRSEHFGLFVEFLRHWYSNRELGSRFAQLDHADAREVDRQHLGEAVRDLLLDPADPFVEALDAEARKCLEVGDYAGLVTARAKLVQERGLVEDYHWNATALREVGELDAAVSVALEGVAKHPNDGTLLFDVALAYWQDDRDVEAIAEIERALAFEPENKLWLRVRAEMLLGLDRTDEAMVAAERQLAREPDDWMSLAQYVRSLVASGRNAEAAEHADVLTELASDEPYALGAAAEAYLSTDAFDAALQHVEAALAIRPDWFEMHRIRGTVQMGLGNYQDACEEFRYMIGDNPDSVFGHFGLSNSLLLSGAYEEALGVVERVIELDPSQGHSYAIRGKCLIELGRLDEGVAAFDSVIDLGAWDSLTVAAAELVRRGQVEVADRYLDRVEEASPDLPLLWEVRVRWCLEVGDYERAIESGRRLEATSRDPRSAQMLVSPALAARSPLDEVLGAVAEAMDGNLTDAARPFGKALAVSVESFGPKYLVGGIQAAMALFDDSADADALESMLVTFLFESGGTFAGHLENWEAALRDLDGVLADRANCHVPLEMLRAAIMYTKTEDEEHLLRLPLEGRKLLGELLPEAVPTGSAR